MKKYLFNPYAVVGLFSLVVPFNTKAQKIDQNSDLVTQSTAVSNLLDEKTQKEIVKNDVLTNKEILKPKSLLQQGKNKIIRSGKSSVINANTCGDMGVENGWDVWSAKEGYHQLGSPNNEYPIFFVPITPAFSPLRFAITTGTGIDSCTYGGSGPVIPVVAPGFGHSSIRLGQPLTNGLAGNCVNNGPYPPPGGGAAGNGCSEQLTYVFTVGSADTNFIYAYAMLVENPPTGHTYTQAPFAEIFILDSNGDTVSCSHQKYTADLAGGILPGFYKSNCSPVYAGEIITYKPWTTTGVNLSNYVAQTLTVVITNTDCALGGHACWSYWDFQCGSIPLNGGCVGTQSSVCAPASDPLNTYTYQWYKNGNILPGSTLQCIGVTQNSGDTYLVNVMPANGCNFYMNYVAAIGSLQSLFTYSTNTDTITFTDLSTAAITWNWNFGDGNTSTLENPSHTYSAVGTYTACLAVTGADGCRDTVCKVITISVVGIEENDFISSVSVFPSPASKTIFLDFGKKNFGEAEILISNLIGEKIYETHVFGSGKQELDVSGFSKGIYFLQLKTTYGIATKKIVIEK